MFSRFVGLASIVAVSVHAVQSKLPTENLFFYETFDEEDPFSTGKWSKSSDEKYINQPLMVKTLTSPLEGEPIIQSRTSAFYVVQNYAANTLYREL